MSRVERRGYLILLCLTSGWVGLIFLPTLADMMGFANAGITFLIHLFFSPVCHQDPSRTLHIFHTALPVCERCSGIYFAFYLTLITYPFFRRRYSQRFSEKMLIPLLVPMLFDYFFDVAGLWTNTTLSRVMSGSAAGIGLALITIPAWIIAAVQFSHSHLSSPTFRRKAIHG